MTDITRPLLAAHEGRHISSICSAVEFVDDAQNHCAHFVNHILGFTEGLTCGKLLGRSGAASNIRVHETFARCPLVGEFAERPDGPCLAFVTQRSAVNLDKRTMVNIPRKHVGIFCDGEIWHYSNASRHVVRQRPEDFARHYQGSGFAVFFGTFPTSARVGATASTAPAAAQAAAPLQEGLKDNIDVVVWQQFLVLKGLLQGPDVHRLVDGHYGAMTREATEDFQAANGFPVEGKVDEATYAAAIAQGFIPRVNAARRSVVENVSSEMTKAAIDALKQLGRTSVFYTEKTIDVEGTAIIARLEPHKHMAGTQLRYWHRGITLYAA